VWGILNKRHFLTVLAIASIVAILMSFLLWATFLLLDERECHPAREIFTGVTYGCVDARQGDGGNGFVHWVRVDLTAPGIELFVTPMNRRALDEGWQYRLRTTEDVVHDEDLAVGINASLFTSSPSWRPRMPGDFSRGLETVVADYVVSHVWEHTYLLWFDDELKPHLRQSKPPTAAELASAKWGIGGQSVWLWDGKVWSGSDRTLDARTAIAIDQERKLLFLAVSSHISPRLMLQTLADLGAKDGMMLDGGSSSSIAIGDGAKGVAPGSVYGSWRPVAPHFGVRARSLFP
jgi:hypothetical protein